MLSWDAPASAGWGICRDEPWDVNNKMEKPPTSVLCFHGSKTPIKYSQEGSEIRLKKKHLRDGAKTLKIDGINYQPQLVHAGFLNHHQYHHNMFFKHLVELTSRTRFG